MDYMLFLASFLLFPLHIHSINYLIYWDWGTKMKRMAHHLSHYHLDWNLLCHVSLISVQAPGIIIAHPALFPSDHSKYYYYPPTITNEVALYCTAFQQSLCYMPDISLVCMEKLHSYPYLSLHHH